MNAQQAHHTISFQNGNEKKIFMSFGLLNQLSAIGGDLTTLPLLQSDPALRDALFALTLSSRNAEGQITKAYNPDAEEFSFSIDQGESLLAWVVAHLQDFFLKRLKCQLELQTRTNAALQKD